jgi:hypothetical protein
VPLLIALVVVALFERRNSSSAGADGNGSKIKRRPLDGGLRLGVSPMRITCGIAEARGAQSGRAVLVDRHLPAQNSSTVSV